MENTEHVKLRVRVDPHEFEFEGPAEIVAAQFELWKAMIERQPNAPSSAEGRQPEMEADHHQDEAQERQAGWSKDKLLKVFRVDASRDLVTLRLTIPGSRAVQDSVLLVLYGYLHLEGRDEVPTTKLMSALESSGWTALKRIDRPLAPYMRDGLVLQTGRLKGTRYRLTTKGVQRAEELMGGLLNQLV